MSMCRSISLSLAIACGLSAQEAEMSEQEQLKAQVQALQTRIAALEGSVQDKLIPLAREVEYLYWLTFNRRNSALYESAARNRAMEYVQKPSRYWTTEELFVVLEEIELGLGLRTVTSQGVLVRLAALDAPLKGLPLVLRAIDQPLKNAAKAIPAPVSVPSSETSDAKEKREKDEKISNARRDALGEFEQALKGKAVWVETARLGLALVGDPSPSFLAAERNRARDLLVGLNAVRDACKKLLACAELKDWKEGKDLLEAAETLKAQIAPMALEVGVLHGDLKRLPLGDQGTTIPRVSAVWKAVGNPVWMKEGFRFGILTHRLTALDSEAFSLAARIYPMAYRYIPGDYRGSNLRRRLSVVVGAGFLANKPEGIQGRGSVYTLGLGIDLTHSATLVLGKSSCAYQDIKGVGQKQQSWTFGVSMNAEMWKQLFGF